MISFLLVTTITRSSQIFNGIEIFTTVGLFSFFGISYFYERALGELGAR
jgi:hypothetical protein